MIKSTSDNRVLWINSMLEDSKMYNFFKQNYNLKTSELLNYEKIHSFSVLKSEDFWRFLLETSKFPFTGSTKVVSISNSSRIPLLKTWFPEIKFNFAAAMLNQGADEKLALVAFDERGQSKELTYKELRVLVLRAILSLKTNRIKKGDRVAAIIKNDETAVSWMLATAALGAIWSSVSPEFGEVAILERFTQIKPKILIATEFYQYGGKALSTLEQAEKIAEKLSATLHLSHDYGICLEENDSIQKLFSELELFDFSLPLYILYSSGTTGAPKCITHTAGGTILQHYKELALHCDLKAEEGICFFTSTGWMMWNWLVSALALGSTIYLFDGSPFYPSPNILWEALEKFQINIFGTSPRYLKELENRKFFPKQNYDLSKLRLILSTGAPLLGSNFDFVYDKIKQNLQLSSISGGSDIVSCFALGNPIAPVRRGELQGYGLAMDVDVYDEKGRSEKIEKSGELICRNSFPSMPIYFYNDENNEKYKKAYFETYQGVWHHGDFAEKTADGGLKILGRSDATLKPGGVRIGSAEIYKVVESIPNIKEAAVIEALILGEGRIVLFVVADGEINKAELKHQIKTQLSPRHVPAYIVKISALPRTINGKLTEVAIRDFINGREVKNTAAITNPSILIELKTALENELNKEC